MELKDARQYYELGAVVGFHVVRDPMREGWLLIVELQNGRAPTLATARGEPRTFQYLQTVVAVVEQIGARVSALKIGI